MSDTERDRMAEAIMNRTGNTALATADALLAAGFGDVTALRSWADGAEIEADRLAAERDALAAQVSAVEAVHHPMTTSSGQWCSHDVKDWPCPTIAAIKRAGQIATHCVGIAFDGSPFCFGCDDWPCPAIERAGQDPT